MRLRNANGKKVDPANDKEQEGEDGDELEGETWSPSKEGFLNFLVDSKLVFDTIERIVDESEDVSCKKISLFSQALNFVNEFWAYGVLATVQMLTLGEQG